ncbi:MAG: hypothetical protein HKN07_08140 [Acidimicrobiia bacterium]|nr:hypothetical protein [Acidimicrobiia bacterium]
MAKRIGRPTREMMDAVNLAIAGKRPQANKLIKEQKLSKKLFDHYLEIRDGQKYTFTRKKTTSRKPTMVRSASAAKPMAVSDDLASMIDGRTKVATLIQIESRVADLLANKPKAEINKVRKAVETVDQLREELEEAEALLGM